MRARPDLVQADRVIAAPTVIRFSPAPERRVFGSLTDARAVADGLGLPPPPVA
jgi:circadian clock protein KaiB